MKKIKALLAVCVISAFMLCGCVSTTYENTPTITNDQTSEISTDIDTLPNSNTFTTDYAKTIKRYGCGSTLSETTAIGQGYFRFTLMNGKISVTYQEKNGEVVVACASIQAASYKSLTSADRTKAMSALFSVAALFHNIGPKSSDLSNFIDNLNEVESNDGATHMEYSANGIVYTYRWENALLSFQAKHIASFGE